MFDVRCLMFDLRPAKPKPDCISWIGMAIFFARTAADCIVGIDEHGA
jgi:hypothetical protein